MTLRLRPCTIKAALPFVRAVHRRLPKLQGALWAVCVFREEEMVGVAVVGHPARLLMADTLAVLRCAVIEGMPNACSMLYGSCSRSAKGMGAENLVTYTHLDEHGTSLKAAGWIADGETDGGEWIRETGPQRSLAIDPLPKRRWFAPWSKRLKVCPPIAAALVRANCAAAITSRGLEAVG